MGLLLRSVDRFVSALAPVLRSIVLVFLSPCLRVFLFAGACLGHLVLMIVSHNWWYGLALPRHTGTSSTWATVC